MKKPGLTSPDSIRYESTMISMCRFLIVKSKKNESTSKFLQKFAELCRTSEKWQGDGWGIYYLQGSEWKNHKSTKSIWDEKEMFGRIPESSFFVAHARGAFGKDTVNIENVQPFSESGMIYVFNGHMKKVRLKMKGNIGAAKIFNMLLEQSKETRSLEKAILNTKDLVEQNSAFIEAMNIAIVDAEGKVYVLCKHSGDVDYHGIRYFQNPEITVICSKGIEDYNFKIMENNKLMVF